MEFGAKLLVLLKLIQESVCLVGRDITSIEMDESIIAGVNDRHDSLSEEKRLEDRILSIA